MSFNIECMIEANEIIIAVELPTKQRELLPVSHAQSQQETGLLPLKYNREKSHCYVEWKSQFIHKLYFKRPSTNFFISVPLPRVKSLPPL